MRANYRLLQLPKIIPYDLQTTVHLRNPAEPRTRALLLLCSTSLWLPRHAGADGEAPPGHLAWAHAPRIVFSAGSSGPGGSDSNQRKRKHLSQGLKPTTSHYFTEILLRVSSLARVPWLCSEDTDCWILQFFKQVVATVQWKINCVKRVACPLEPRAACSYLS